MDTIEQQSAHPGWPLAKRVLVDALDKHWRNCRKALKRCQSKFSTKRVHQLRITLRRCIAVFDALLVQVKESEVLPLRRSLSKQLNQLGPLRDVQNQMRFITRLYGSAQPGVQQLQAQLFRNEARLIKRACRDIARMGDDKLKRRMAVLAEKLSDSLDQSEESGIRLRAHALLTERFATVMWRLSYVKPDDPESVHRVRVAFKKYRYLIEIWQPLFPQFTDGVLARMQIMQDRFGEVQDLRVFEQTLAAVKVGKSRSLPELRALAQQRLIRRMKSLPVHLNHLPEFQPGAFE